MTVVLDPVEAEILKEALVEWSEAIDHTSARTEVERQIRFDREQGGSIIIEVAER